MNFEFIVSDRGGLPLYSYNNNPEKNIYKDSALISGFLRAANLMSKSDLGDEIKAIEFGDNLIVLYKSKLRELYYILIAQTKKNKSLNKKLEEIANNFEKKYESALVHWNGNQCIFSGFNEYLHKLK